MRLIRFFAGLVVAALMLLATGCDKEKEIAVTGVSLTPTTLTLNVGDTQALTATVSPSNATNKAVSWTTDDPSMNVIVMNEGTVKALGAGTATVTVTTQDGGFKATCDVTVKKAEDPGPGKIAVESISLGAESASLTVGEELTLTATVKPENATEAGNVSWASSKPDVATVTGSGKSATVKAVASGTADITATADGKSATLTVTVNPAGYVSIEMKEPEVTLEVGDSRKLEITCQPEDAKDKSLTWSSDKEGVATVGSDGTVKAIAEGEATITVQSNAGPGKATCKVSVKNQIIPVESVTLSGPASAKVGSEETYSAVYYPSNATDGDKVSWSIEGVQAEMSTEGLKAVISFMSAGTATLSVTVGGCSASIVITVTESPESSPAALMDMGLPSGTLWCKYNLGATESNLAGNHFAWGETEPKTEFNISNYRYYNSGEYTKYNGSDGLSLLLAEDDAATLILGEGYRLPTRGEYDELVNEAYTTVSWAEENGVKGLKVVSKANGNSLFFPLAPFKDSADEYPNGLNYWTATGSTGYSVSEWSAFFRLKEFGEDFGLNMLDWWRLKRWCGANIRAVYAPRHSQTSGITVSSKQVTVPVGGSVQLSAQVLPEGSPQQIFWLWTSSKPYTIDRNGLLTLHENQGATIYVYDGIGGFSENIEVIPQVVYTQPEAVDLGLKSGTLWASWDLGASKPEEPGACYAWGETEPKLEFSPSNYKWWDGSDFTKYDVNNRFLEQEDDAAAVHLGGDWRIPNKAQLEELILSCTLEATTVNGMPGQKVVGPNQETIFLPYGGYDNGVRREDGFWYQSCELSPDYPENMFYVGFVNSSWGIHDDAIRSGYGLCIRPVIPAKDKDAVGIAPASEAARIRSLGPVGGSIKARSVLPARSVTRESHANISNSCDMQPYIR